VLGDLPDGSFAAFTAAIERTIHDADAHAARVVNTFSYER
jgi:hypothetical protein